MQNLKIKRILLLAAAAALSGVILTGCADERTEDKIAYRKIGINSMENGDYTGAVSAFNSALGLCVGEIGETELDICYYKAAAQYAGGDMEGAIGTYQALLDYNSKDGRAYYLRGSLYLQNGDREKALADFEKAITCRPEDYELYVSIYENLAGNNMAEEGKEYLNKAFSVKGNSGDHLAWRGRIYYLLEEYENAEKELKAAIDKKSVDASLYLAQVYEARGDTAAAEESYKAYVDSGAADSAAMNALGEIEMAKGNYEKALEYLKNGLEMEEVPNKRELLQNQLISYEYSGDFNAAWGVAQQYVELYPDDDSLQREYIFLKTRAEGGTQTEKPEGTEKTEGPEQPEGTEKPEGTE